MKITKVALSGIILLCLILTSSISMAQGHKRHLRMVSNPIKVVTSDTDLWWLSAKDNVYRHVNDLIEQDKSEIERNAHHSKFMNGNINRKWVAITFDDGPHPKYTPKILSILKRNNVKATFFVVGMMAENFPDLIRDEIAAGHSVGNHTYHHVNLKKIPPIYVAAELKACGEVLKAIDGKAPHLFRPPGGDYDDVIAATAEKLGYTTVLWTDDPGDYASPGSKVIDMRTIQHISNGGIILIHDGVQQTISILPGLIKQLKAKGFELVTIDDMMARTTMVKKVAK